MFAYSGADGTTQEGSGFVGLYQPQLYQVQFLAGDALLDLGVAGDKTGYVLAATSDVIAVASGNPTDDMPQDGSGPKHASSQAGLPEVVLTYQAWDTLVGYAPSVALKGVWREDQSDTTRSSAIRQSKFVVCNISGKWHDHSEYVIAEVADGKFSVTSLTPHSWAHASGSINLQNGSVTITYDNGKVDHAQMGSSSNGCSEISWLSSFGGTWFRDAGVKQTTVPFNISFG